MKSFLFYVPKKFYEDKASGDFRCDFGIFLYDLQLLLRIGNKHYHFKFLNSESVNIGLIFCDKYSLNTDSR